MQYQMRNNNTSNGKMDVSARASDDEYRSN
jgi:hypothetical protein